MKLGVILGLDRNIEAKMAEIKDMGFETCQLVCWDPSIFNDEYVEIVNKAVENTGIQISEFWCGYTGPKIWNFIDGPETLGIVPTTYRYQRAEELIKGAEFAKKLGVTDVVTHAGFIPEDPNSPDYAGTKAIVSYIAGALLKNGQNFLFETGQETPVTLLRLIEDVGTGNLGINLDPANLILYGKANPVDALDVFGKYVRNLHAKDGCYPTNGHDLGLETRVGEGKVDFKGVFKKLHELGYDSYVTIEREIDGDQQLVDILESRDYLQSIIDEVYGN